MEQRRLRLGDILDDYCPRERRVTNHAVVAMVEETVKQTRCTTCDAEHAYKGGHAPRRRNKEGPSALYKEVLAGKPDTDVPTGYNAPEVFAAADAPDDGAAAAADGDVNGNLTTGGDVAAPAIASRPAPAARRERAPESAPKSLSSVLPSVIPSAGRSASNDASDASDANDANDANEANEANDADERGPDSEDGPVHRQLIRATLPRIEGQKDERRPTDFTIRQSSGRGNNPGNQFRGGGGGNPARERMRSGGRGSHGGHGGNAGNTGHSGHGGNGHRPHGGPRFAGARSGQGQGQGPGRGQGGGFRSTQPPRHGGGRKRSR